MRNVIRRALRARRDDRGAVGVLVGVLIASGVLFGMAAVVVDVGSIYAERAQLQNGADAGALAVAKGCAMGSVDCSDSTESEGPAGRYANANANDEASAVDLVCGFHDALPLCPDSTGTKIDCPEAPPSGTNYVDVHTSTISEDRSSTLLPPAFAHTLAGNESPDGTSFGACARAAWGAPKSADGLALTISWCEWDAATSGGSDYAPPPPEVPAASYEKVLYFHKTASENPDGSTPCNAEPSGADIPGGFGWTVAEDGTCTTDFNFDEDSGSTTYDAAPGNSVTDSPECVKALEAAWTNRTVLIMPVYDGTPTGGGKNGQYTLHQPAGFVITGYFLGGQVKKPSWLPGSPIYDQYPCGGSDRCISGYFTTAVTSGTIGSGTGTGVSVVQLTG